MPDDPAVRWLHLGCGGRIFWDLSGAFCGGCYDENLGDSDMEKVTGGE